MAAFSASSSLVLSAALILAAAAIEDDTAALSLFRNQTDIHGALLENWPDSAPASPCAATWRGVACTNNRVSAVSLAFLDLRGPIDALASLDQLRELDLAGNRLYGSVAPITKCLNLEKVNLSGNDFSGEIPPEISSLSRLRSLDLSDNNLHGSIPPELSNLSLLRDLQLQNNQLSGTIPNSLDSLANLKILNLSNNEMNGNLPENLQSRFGSSSFSGNQGLCGAPPFPICSSSSAVPAPSIPNSTSSSPTPNHRSSSSSILSKEDAIAISVVVSFLLITIALFALFYHCRNVKKTNPTAKSHSSPMARIVSVQSTDNNNSSGKGEIVFFDRRNLFRVEDLLQSSAEVIGKGSLGIVYKAIIADQGLIVAVKRLRDADPCSRREFELYMDVIGKLRHPNLVRLRGYYYATEEKLLVYDYMPNGSLHSLLHEPAWGRGPLDWTTRVRLLAAAARGLSAIHTATGIPHANVKSSNVLLDKNGSAHVSDFALSFLLSPGVAISKLGGYRAPEQARTGKHSTQADVYAFGVVLLEALTGVDPDAAAANFAGWVRRTAAAAGERKSEAFDPALRRFKNDVEGEMRAMMRVATACVATLPENRPSMTEVVRMIEEIGVEQSGSLTPSDAAAA
ncbi:leucine-rich repeat receptor-like protein kinase PXC1 [Andrographis paniculata]|uniref:leucine-rich repeat receptor-like protein kinase PXC1 n=1 Tax=Andrographis paniculata TaxID=175694 RepID=UPI0021E70910|nr:leucine-rich repeat receptor-like protein kinase PXC1 [Andrographis paniculata]